MRPDDTGLLVVDLQDRLLAAQPMRGSVVWNVSRLVRGAEVFGMPMVATEQNPEKLGPTTAEVAEWLDLGGSRRAISKMSFSCCPCGDWVDRWRSSGLHRVLVCGIETHVCVQQTVLDLLAAGFQVIVAVDAVGSRFTVDHQTALRRIEAAGGLLTTTEAASSSGASGPTRPNSSKSARWPKKKCPNSPTGAHLFALAKNPYNAAVPIVSTLISSPLIRRWIQTNQNHLGKTWPKIWESSPLRRL